MCSSHPLSHTIAPARVTSTWLIVDYNIHQSFISIHDDDVMMINNMTCMEGKPADETIALLHGAQSYCAGNRDKYFGLVTFFVA